MEALGYALSLGYGAICLLSAFLLSKLGVDTRITRKLVHIFIGFEWVILYIFHGATYHFLIVCLVFLLLLVFAYKRKLLKMISSNGDNAPGTVYYAVSMSVMALACCFCVELMIPFGIAVFCTSLGDGLAGVVGQSIKRFNPRLQGTKSLWGAVSNFTLSALTAAIFSSIFNLNFGFWHVFCIAIFSVELELFTEKGLDNISLPLGVFALSSAFVILPNTMDYIIPVILTPIVIALVSRKHLLTRSGIFAALMLDIAISISLGNFGFVLLLLFLVLGSISDNIKKLAKDSTNIEKLENKGSCRDHTQVLANATVSAVCAISFRLTDAEVLVICFSASLAEALADTFASSFGAFSKITVDLFKFRKCEKGISGGMSLCGTLSALVAVLIMGGGALAFSAIGTKGFLIVLISGFGGTVFDSLLGSLVQVKYKCRICGKTVEREEHCGVPTAHSSGIGFVTNDIVNLLSTAFSALVAAYLYILL